MSRPYVWFITPCHMRLRLTAICLKQRRRLIDDLKPDGIRAQCVVITCDQPTVRAAQELGFPVIQRDNDYLGARANDGIQYAFEHGASHVCGSGSDAWIHPDYFRTLPPSGTCQSSRWATAIREDGCLAAILRVGYEGGVGYRIYPRNVMQPLDYRPVQDTLTRGIDGGILQGLETSGRVTWRYTSRTPMHLVDFKTAEQLNTYREVARHWAIRELPNPFRLLRRYYPADLVDQVEDYYATEAVAA